MGVDPRGFQKCGGRDSRDPPPPPVGDAPVHLIEFNFAASL